MNCKKTCYYMCDQKLDRSRLVHFTCDLAYFLRRHCSPTASSKVNPVQYTDFLRRTHERSQSRCGPIQLVLDGRHRYRSTPRTSTTYLTLGVSATLLGRQSSLPETQTAPVQAGAGKTFIIIHTLIRHAMCYGDRSRQRTAEQTSSSAEDTDETVKREESPSRGIVAGSMRALKRAYALMA